MFSVREFILLEQCVERFLARSDETLVPTRVGLVLGDCNFLYTF